MTPTQLVGYALLLGAAGGALLTYTAVRIRQQQRDRAASLRPELPQLAIDILNRLEYPAIVLDRSLTPIYTNAAARADQRDSARVCSNPAFLRQLRQVLSTGVPLLQQPEQVTAQPSHRNYQTQAFRLTRQFVAVLLRDTGEEQRLTAIRRDFIANMSHELKTPAAAITLLAEAIQEAAGEPETVADFAATMAQEAQRLSALTRDIINLSQAQAELRTELLEPVSLVQLVRDQVAAHRNYAAQAEVELVLTTHPATDNDAIIMGDPSALGIAIANVLSNAIRYTPAKGRVGIGISCNGDSLDVAVTDTGPGIAPEHLDRIFERFFRVNSARTRHPGAGGTGLGLAIARHTLRAHGGDITVWSKPQLGSTFTLHFPLAPQPPQNSQTVAQPNRQNLRSRLSRRRQPAEVSHAAMHRELAAQFAAAGHASTSCTTVVNSSSTQPAASRNSSKSNDSKANTPEPLKEQQ